MRKLVTASMSTGHVTGR